VTYRAYGGPRGSEAIAPLEKDRLLYKEFDTLDDALTWARHLNQGDRVALLIEGDDGTRLGKRDIAARSSPRGRATRSAGESSRPSQLRREAGMRSA
jgi:hypothetical protein